MVWYRTVSYPSEASVGDIAPHHIATQRIVSNRSTRATCEKIIPFIHPTGVLRITAERSNDRASQFRFDSTRLDSIRLDNADKAIHVSTFRTDETTPFVMEEVHFIGYHCLCLIEEWIGWTLAIDHRKERTCHCEVRAGPIQLSSTRLDPEKLPCFISFLLFWKLFCRFAILGRCNE